MLTIYLYDPSKKGQRYLKSSLKRIIKRNNMNIKIMAVSKNSSLFLSKIKPKRSNLFLLPYRSSEDAFVLGKAVRAKDPEAFIVYWIQEPVDYLKIIQSNIEVVDILDKRQEDFLDNLMKLLLWTEASFSKINMQS